MANFWHEKMLPKKSGKFLKNGNFWQYLPNLAPSDNPGHQC